MAHRPISIGLTGGIGSGKSTAGMMLRCHGAAIIDADQISHEITGPGGAAIHEIRQIFGDQSLDERGALNRSYVRQLAFNDPQVRLRLESVIHPLVSQISAQQAQAAAEAQCPLVVFDIPLLVESKKWTRQLTAIIVIDCPEEIQIQRVMQRNGMARELVEAIIATQAPRAKRRSVADISIFNGSNCTLEMLQNQVTQVAGLFGI